MRPYPRGRGFFILGICLLLSVLPITNPLTVGAQDEKQDYTGVDVVFLVDQSGSMGGLNYGSKDHPQANDPNDLRFSGLQQMVERLAGYRLNYFHDSDVQFQIAVVYFGSRPVTIVTPTIIDPDTSDEWQPLSSRLQSELSADAFPTNLGNTDHLSALREAKSILQAMQQTWQDGEHLQVILMLTDGEWYLSCPEMGEEALAYCRDGEFQSFEYRQMLAKYIQDELSYPRYRFFVGAINDRSNEYWSRVRGYWSDWTHNNAELVDANTMWAFFEGILAELTVNEPGLADKKTTRGEVVEIPETQDRIAVPPYLQEITFVIHKPEPEVRVKMYQDGQLLEGLATATVKDRDRYIESITILNPEPGYITIERPVSAGILRIFMIQIVANAACDPLSSVPQYIPVRLQCTLSGRGGALPPYDDLRFRLTVEAEIQGDGTSQHLVLTPQGESKYTAYYLPAQPGKYAFNIVATTQKPDGEPFELFRKPPEGMATFEVKPTTVHLNVAGTPTTLLPVLVSVVLTDASGAPLQVPPESAAFVQMCLTFTIAGQDTSIDLSPGEAGYQGTFTPSHPGKYRVHLLGQVKDPATGQQFTTFDEDMGSLEVQPPRVIWDGFSSPWPQYRAAPVTFYLADQTGNPMGDQMDPSWRLEAQASVKGGGLTEAVPLTVEKQGRWTGEFTPQKAGDFTLTVSVQAESPIGEKIPLVEDHTALLFTIRPMSLVRILVTRPQAEEYAWRDLFWRPRPLGIEVAVTDEAGKPLAPAQIQKNPAETTLAVEVISPEGQTTGPLKLTHGSAPGRYLASFNDYGPFNWYAHRDLGWCEIRVHPLSDLKEAYIYEKPDGVTVRVHLGRHPQWWVLPTILGVWFAILSAYLAYQMYLHLWSAEGTLTIEGAGPGWTRRLRDYGKHTLAFTARDGLPASIRKVVVHQPRGLRNPPVEVTVELRPRGRFSFKRMVDGARKSLGGNVFVSYQRGIGASSAVRASMSLAVLSYGLASLVMLAGLGGVIFSVIASLG